MRELDGTAHSMSGDECEQEGKQGREVGKLHTDWSHRSKAACEAGTPR